MSTHKQDEKIAEVSRRIDREKQFIAKARTMRQATDNPAVQSRADNEIRDSQKNLMYLEEKMRELQLLSSGGGTDDGSGQYDHRGSYGSVMPPNRPYAQQQGGARTRPNYSKLDLIKYDTPHLGPRIQLMLSQLQFKLSVEKQYKEGIEKMASLYRMDGDRKSKADAEAKRVESAQKIQLLKQALKRYEGLHVDLDTGDGGDDESINAPNYRKPLSGRLTVRVIAVKDVDHAATSRFTRGPETSVVIKVEDSVVLRTRTTRNDKWMDENHEMDVDKANEIEITVYDKPGDHLLPIGMLWVRISDIAEEMRRKKVEQEVSNSNSKWVRAENMDNNAGPTSPTAQSFSGFPSQNDAFNTGGRTIAAQPPQHQTAPLIDAWFALEPVGQIRLQLKFVKSGGGKARPDIGGLGRQGAVRQRKEEVHEKYGHKFVQHQFYNIMRCALCGDFLKYAAGYQCSDCKYTCHKKCYTKVVTKCISKSNAETDPDEEKLNHRIPHRFEAMTNIGANWCCHCGYMLPVGKKNARKCSECALTCHAQCAHLVPDFCGMSMETANQFLQTIRTAKRNTGMRQHPPNVRQSQPASAPQLQSPESSHQRTHSTPAASPYPPYTPEDYAHPPYSPTTSDSMMAANKAFENSSMYQPQPQQHSQYPPRTDSSMAAAAVYNPARPAVQSPTTGSFPQPLPYDPRQQAGGMYQQQSQPQIQDQGHYGQQQQYQQKPLPVPQPEVQAPQQTTPYPPDQRNYQMQVQQQRVPQPVQPVQTIQQKPQKIGLDHFNFLAVLGKGNFGKVMLAETKSTKKLYAIKVLKKEFIIENDEVESMRSEKRVFLIANKARHPFLLNLHACFQTETRVYFVMEYVSGGDLMLHIQRESFGTKRAQFYAAEVCLALKYFHDNKVIYRDLKLDNILLTLDGHIKIADYGLCKENMDLQDTTGTFCGTPEFMAPEILMDKKYGRAVDWWAFGVLIYQMLLQQSPFRGDDEDEIYDAILQDEPLYPIHMPRESVSILQKLLTREPEQRLGSGPSDAEEIMNHAFFRNINWDDIYHKRVAPPFKPQIKSPTDTSNFDSEFTSVTPVLTPVQSVLTAQMQEEFRGFSYAHDFA